MKSAADIPQRRAEAETYGAALQRKADNVAADWLE